MTMTPVTIVNHVAVDIAAAPDAVWRVILDEYVDAKKFRETYTVEPLVDPGAVLGGYGMWMKKAGEVVDERVVYITERDDASRRLSLFADYLSVAGGMQVFATYQAHTTVVGVRYTLDCHARLGIEAPASGSREEIAAAVAQMKAHFDTALVRYLDGIKTRLEGA